MRIKILVDADEFWECLKEDIVSSKKDVLIETLSFEGDSVGKKLSHLLLSSTSNDIRVLVDSFTRFVLSDRFLYHPKNLYNRALRQEAIETVQMIALLNNSGIQVKFTNSVGPLLMRFAKRNHKKLVVIDDKIAYIGGMNFSEHNFHWHDMMLRIEDPDIASFLREDFMSTWSGQSLRTSKRFKGIQLYILDGYSNEVVFREFFNIIESAKERIYIESPYLTFPFYERLKQVRRKGVPITIIAPKDNNLRFLNKYTNWEAKRCGFDLRLYEGRMTHLKAVLVDNDVLLVGSSNLDYLSYRSHQEIMAIITDLEVISVFREKVIYRDLMNSSKSEGIVNNLNGHLRHFTLRSLGKLVVFLGKCHSKRIFKRSNDDYVTWLK